VYTERLVIDSKAISLIGEDGADETIIDAAGSGVPLTILSDAVVEGFTITGGVRLTDSEDGGGLLVLGGAPVVRDSTITGNAGLLGGGVRVVGAGLTLEGVTITDNHATFGGGLYGELSDITFRRVSITNHEVGGDGGAFNIRGGSLTVNGLTMDGNIAGGLGGAGYALHAEIHATGIVATNNGEAEVMPDGSRVFNTLGGGGLYTSGVNGRIDASRFIDNRAAFGGGVYVAGTGTLEIVNTLVTGSLAAQGAILANGSSPIITNCTVVDNDQWGLFSLRGSSPVVRNSIFSGNQIGISSIEIGGAGVADVAWSLINGDAAATLGDGIVNADPMLDDSFSPLPGAPVIDAGDNTAVPAGIETDLLSGDRFIDDPATTDTGVGDAPIVDLGAIEFNPGDSVACIADMDSDGSLTILDYLAFQNAFGAGDVAADMDDDGQLTMFDFLTFQNAFDAGCP
jgi:parallel beta-helix repeat protein